jgi:hypothetical protein
VHARAQAPSRQWPWRATTRRAGPSARSIFIRESFFAGREFTDVADLNTQARCWCEGRAFDRPWPQDDTLTARQAFAVELASLLGLPATGYALGQRLEVAVAKTTCVRFDWNDYTVPHTHVRRTLSVLADQQRVLIFEAVTELANQPRSFDRHQQIEEQRHLQTLVEHKRRVRGHRGADVLAQVAPASTELLLMAAQRGHNLGRSPLHCCVCSTSTGRRPCRPPSWRRSGATCPIRTPCVLRWSDRANAADVPRRWPWRFPRT